MKNSIGNRTRDLQACSAVPQPTAPVTGLLASILTYVLAKTKQENWLLARSGHPLALIIVAFAIPASMFIFCMCFVRVFPDLCMFP